MGTREKGVHGTAARRRRAPAALAAAVEQFELFDIEFAGAGRLGIELSAADELMCPNFTHQCIGPADPRVAVCLAPAAAGRSPERAVCLCHLRRQPVARTHRLRALREARPRVPSAGVNSTVQFNCAI